jgi:hypothetical protein
VVTNGGTVIAPINDNRYIVCSLRPVLEALLVLKYHFVRRQAVNLGCQQQDGLTTEDT